MASLVAADWREPQPKSRSHPRGSKALRFLGTIDLECHICLGKLGRPGRCSDVESRGHKRCMMVAYHASICFMKFTRAISASFNANARVLDVPVTLAFDTSNRDVDVFMHIDQVVVHSDPAFKELIS